MAKVLATDVHVTNEKGEAVRLEAGSKVPKWATELVTNPKAFAEKAEESADDAGQQPPQTPPAAPASSEPAYEARRENVDEVHPYDTWAYHELQQESIGRKLDGGGSGKGEEIVARLRADDAAQQPPQQ